MLSYIENALDEFKRAQEIIQSIKINTDNCEKIAMSIHQEISPIGLTGKSGILRDTPIIENLNTILSSSTYTLNCLRGIISDLKKNPEIVQKLKEANFHK